MFRKVVVGTLYGETKGNFHTRLYVKYKKSYVRSYTDKEWIRRYTDGTDTGVLLRCRVAVTFFVDCVGLPLRS